MDGIPLVPRMIGLFGILSVLKIAEKVGQESGDWNGAMVDEAEKRGSSSTGDKVAFPSLSMCKRLCSYLGAGFCYWKPVRMYAGALV